MDIPNNFYRTSIKALILNEEGKFLLCKEENGMWDLPGGGLDFGESIRDCITRELGEENGFKLIKFEVKPVTFTVFKNLKGFWASNVLYKVEVNTDGFTPSEECLEFRYFNIVEALKENIYPSVIELVKALNEN